MKFPTLPATPDLPTQEEAIFDFWRNNEIEFKVQEAKTIIDKCKKELHIKNSDLDKVIDDFRKKIEGNTLKL